MSVAKLSVIIVTHNSEKDIYDCLSSIYSYNDIGDGLEIIVVDNCSSNFQRMREKIYDIYGNNVIVVSNTSNGGYGQGNNRGIKMASAPIIAIMNPDVRLIMPIFNTALSTLQAKNALMCGGLQYYSQEQKACSYNPIYNLHPFTRFLCNYIGIKTNRYFDKYMWLQGAFFFIKKKEFLSIGGFDENIFMYGEEYDIHERLIKAFPKARFIFMKNCRYLHLAGDREFSPKQYETLLRSLVYIMQKNGHNITDFLRNERLYTIIIYRVTNFANFIHHREKRLPLRSALTIIDKLIKEY